MKLQFSKSRVLSIGCETLCKYWGAKKVYHLKVKIKNAFKEAGSSGEFKTISTTQSVSVEQLEKDTKDFFKGEEKHEEENTKSIISTTIRLRWR
ncbi:MAG: hypothetical protein MR356_07220 [Agathobacter sp.]|nr:hypothetical protein [Agathobacter sp.]